MLNDDQLRVAVLLDWETASVLPLATAEAVPEDTKPFTPDPQLVATQGTGSAVTGTLEPATVRPLQSATAKITRPLRRRLSKDRSARRRIKQP
jgi:hypothetical protein